ncbi:MAG: D-alanyl-D-alanine carboxypeptidase family protein, partial [Bacilli bacterium]
MKKIIFIFIFILLIPSTILGLETNAESAILMDTDNKRIIYAKNINNVQSVASISKIMTAIVAIENGQLNKKVKIGKEIEGSYGSGIYIKKGEILTKKDLLYGLMLRSGNDAALAIAYHTYRNVPKFINEMNEKAKEIGMKNSVFNNPSGLDQVNGNFSTAYDMAILTSYAMQNDIYKEIVKTKKYVLKTNKNTYVWHNKHRLLKQYMYTTGGKTGFTQIARRTLVTTATKNNLNLVVVTLKDSTDFSDHIKLFEYGFNNYNNKLILKKGYIKIDQENYYKDNKLYIKEK